MWTRQGTRWRKYQQYPTNFAPKGTVHIQWWFERERKWVFFCSRLARYRGIETPDGSPVTCIPCGRMYTD